MVMFHQQLLSGRSYILSRYVTGYFVNTVIGPLPTRQSLFFFLFVLLKGITIAKIKSELCIAICLSRSYFIAYMSYKEFSIQLLSIEKGLRERITSL